MATVEITCPRLQEVIDRLEEIKDTLPAALGAANQEIIDQIEDVLPELYGPKLAKFWQTEQAVGPDSMASVRVWTVHPYVYGFEYGTKKHIIAPTKPRVGKHGGRLGPMSGSQSFVSGPVNHPGTRAKDKRAALQIALGMAARQAWYNAIYELLEAE